MGGYGGPVLAVRGIRGWRFQPPASPDAPRQLFPPHLGDRTRFLSFIFFVLEAIQAVLVDTGAICLRRQHRGRAAGFSLPDPVRS